MSKLDDNRVLGRMGARVITAEEAEAVSGCSVQTTIVCTSILATSTVTGTGDGECADTDGDHGFI
jgi:hypothetical protein